VSGFGESVIEDAALAWLQGVGWNVAHGPDLAPGSPAAERHDYQQVVLERRLRDALARLNPTLPSTALEDAYRKLTRPGGATLTARNRAFHRMVVDGVAVEYREDGGAIRGAQVEVIAFGDVVNNEAISGSLNGVMGGEGRW
jgi:type I restriction enzyme R subunit